MQFAEPDWQPKVTRDFSTGAQTPTPAPQPGVSPGPASGPNAAAPPAEVPAYDEYAQGYRPQDTVSGPEETSFQQQPPPGQGQQQQQQQYQYQQQSSFRPQQPWFSRLPAWAWWLIGVLVVSGILQPAMSEGGPLTTLLSLLFVAALALLGWALFTRRMRISLAGERQAAETHTFTVGPQPTVVLKNRAGSITLRAGDEGQVGVTTHRRGYLFSPRFEKEMPIAYSQDDANNTVSVQAMNWRPFGKNVIDFEVVVPPQADLQLTTSFGQIAVEHVAGRLVLRSEAGTIQATQVTLRDTSSLKTSAGTIVFEGDLAPSGNSELITSLGTINATLPAASSFAFDAQTGLGNVATNLPLVQTQRNQAHGTVGGPGPYPHLKLKTDVGSINLARG